MAEGKPHGILHGASLSPFVRKVRAVLGHKSVDYELVHVMPGAMDAAFLGKSPLSKIPVWEEDGWTLPDSSAICAYLERQVPEPPIYPTDPKPFAAALFWEEYADTRLVDSIAPVFFQRVVRHKVFAQPADEGIVRRQLDEVLPPVFDQLEALFFGDAAASSTDALTIANVSVWAPLVNLEHSGVEIDPKASPKLAAFVAGMEQHPVLHAIVEEERAAMRAARAS